MRIMIVDNDRAFLRSLEIQLQQRGHQVSSCEDPALALEALRADEPPDVIVVDLVMPQSSGVQFIERARELLGAGCMMILVSGHTDVVKETNLEELAGVEFLPKPLDMERLDALLLERPGRYVA